MRRLACLVIAACHGSAQPVSPHDDAEVAVLERLLAATPEDSAQRPDLEFRIADTLDRHGDRVRALAAFRALLDDPRARAYRRRDEVLFWYAHSLGEAGRAGDSIAVLGELLAGYPATKYRGDALLARAELGFDRGDLAAALADYQAAGFGPDDDRTWYARYRVAWCHYRLGDPTGATAELAGIAESAPTGSAARKKLIAQARADLASWAGAHADPTYAEADRLYAAGRFCDAAPLYVEVARGEPVDAMRIEAAYANVLATTSCEGLTGATPDAASGNLALAIPASWQRVIAATELYLVRAGSSADVPVVQFRRARILYSFAHLADAARGFRDVVAAAHDDDLLGAAATLLLDCDARGDRGELDGDLRTVCALHVAKTGDLARVCSTYSK